MNPVLRKTLPYAAQKDFVPISVIGRLPLLVLVKPSMPVKSIKELIDYAKANPNSVNYASSAPLFQLATELFKQKTGTTFVGVNYKSSGEAAMALMSGEITLSISDVPAVASLVKSGDLRALAYTNDTRAKLAAMAADAVGNSPEEFGKVLRDDSEKWGRVVKEANIRAD